jgi:hypothetical protein
MPRSHAPIAASAVLSDQRDQPPRLLFLRGEYVDWSGKFGARVPVTTLPGFIRWHLQQHVKCLSFYFDVVVINGACDYQQVCEQYQPDLALFESGVYGSPRDISNISAVPNVPKLGLLHEDALGMARSVFLSDMEHWGIETYFTISVAMAEYLPAVADQLFVWPNFIDPDVFHDYSMPKIIPVLVTGSHASQYPWRNRVNKVIAEHFPALTCPHFGWMGQNTARTIYNQEYAKMINASYVVPTCGTITKEVVRKHFEIPGAKACLITEGTHALKAAGFADMQNCVFADTSDVLDKLEYLLRHRDKLAHITREGYRLVHSRHTLRQRGQIAEWLRLHQMLRPGQRIVQTGPFGPLGIVDARSRARNAHSVSNGIDRAILRSGDEALRQGNYDKAERDYISCLNYWPYLPEAILGLTLCRLYKGDAQTAVARIAEPIANSLEHRRAADPDPVEWAYFIISLLCQGDLEESSRRARQFPRLRHPELDRCRQVIDVLCGSASGLVGRSGEDPHPQWRPSVHQLPERDMARWIDDLCTMLIACRQGALAERLQNTLRRTASPPVSAPLAWEGSVRTRDIDFARLGAVLPLTSVSLPEKLRRHVPWRIRAMAHPLLEILRSLSKCEDEFARAVRNWAREDEVRSALIIGACDSSILTRAFLVGIRQNPAMPVTVCQSSSANGLKKLSEEFIGNSQVRFIVGSVDNAKDKAEVENFEIVLLDQETHSPGEAIKALRGARTVLIRDINTYIGHLVVRKLVSENEFRIVDEDVSVKHSYVILTRANRCKDVGPGAGNSRSARMAEERGLSAPKVGG